MTHTHQHTLCHFISLRGFLLLALTNLHSLDVAFIFMPKQSTLCVCFRRDSYVFILSAISQLEAKNPICLLLIRELYMCVCVCVHDTHFIPLMCESAWLPSEWSETNVRWLKGNVAQMELRVSLTRNESESYNIIEACPPNIHA